MKFERDNYTPPPQFDGNNNNSDEELQASEYQKLEKKLPPHVRGLYMAQDRPEPSEGCIENISRKSIINVKTRQQRTDLEPIEFILAYAKTTAEHKFWVHVKTCPDCKGLNVYEPLEFGNEEENNSNWLDDLLLKDVPSLSRIEQTAHCAILIQEFFKTLVKHHEKEFFVQHFIVGYSYQELSWDLTKNMQLDKKARAEKRKRVEAVLRKKSERIKKKLLIFMTDFPPHNNLPVKSLNEKVAKI